MRHTRFLTVVVALALATAACGGKSAEEKLIEEILESEGITDVDISGDGEDFSFTIEDEDGGDFSVTGGGEGDEFEYTVEGEDGETFTVGGGDIPDDMVIPVIPGGNVQMSMESQSDVTLSLIYPDGEFRNLVEFYDDELDPNSDDVYRSTTSFTTEDGEVENVTWSATDGSWNVTVVSCFGMTVDGDGGTCVSIYESR